MSVRMVPQRRVSTPPFFCFLPTHTENKIKGTKGNLKKEQLPPGKLRSPLVRGNPLSGIPVRSGGRVACADTSAPFPINRPAVAWPMARVLGSVLAYIWEIACVAIIVQSSRVCGGSAPSVEGMNNAANFGPRLRVIRGLFGRGSEKSRQLGHGCGCPEPRSFEIMRKHRDQDHGRIWSDLDRSKR